MARALTQWTRWWFRLGLCAAVGLGLGLGLGAPPAQAQRVSLTDLQNQIAALQNQLAASVACPAAMPGQARFVDKGDGTICDAATGLMWEKKLDCGGVIANNPRCVANTYNWSRSPAVSEPNGTLFALFLGTLNGLSSGVLGFNCFAQHCDWRIPTMGELQSILVKFPNCAAGPCIDPIFDPTTTGNYFSSTQDASNFFLPFAWGIAFVTFPPRAERQIGKQEFHFARAVRGGR